MKFSRMSSFYLCATLLTPSLYYAPLTAAKANPAIDEVMLEAQRYMDELSKLSPEEQEKRILADIAKMDEDLKNMTPEQRQQFDEFMSSPELAEAMEEIIPLEEEEIVPPSPRPTAKPTAPTTVQEVDKREKALQLLAKIVKNTNQFLLQAGKMSTFAGKVKQWYTDKTSPELILWPTPLDVTKETTDPKKKDTKEAPAPKIEASTEWSSISDHIATLVQKCGQLQAKDKNNNYKYLDFLLEDKALYADLEKLNSALSLYVDVIAIPEFGMGELTSKSENAIRNTINSLTEAIYSKQMIKAINAVIEKYEPTEKKLREEQEKIDKKALAESKKTIKPSRMTVAGSDGAGAGYGGGASDTNQYNPYGGYGTPYNSPAASAQTGDELRGAGNDSSTSDSPAGGGAAASGEGAKGGRGMEETAEQKNINQEIMSLGGDLAELEDDLGNPPFTNLATQVKRSPDLAMSQIKNVASSLQTTAKKASRVRNSIKRVAASNESLGKRLEQSLGKTLDPYRGKLENALGQTRTIKRSDVPSSIDASGIDTVKNSIERILGRSESPSVFGGAQASSTGAQRMPARSKKQQNADQEEVAALPVPAMPTPPAAIPAAPASAPKTVTPTADEARLKELQTEYNSLGDAGKGNFYLENQTEIERLEKATGQTFKY